MENEYQQSVAPKLGIDISLFTRAYSSNLSLFKNLEGIVEHQLSQLLTFPVFDKYQQIFDSFGFGLRTRARLLSRIYPFESFLLPSGKFWVERTQRLTTPTKGRSRTQRKRIENHPTTTKTTKKNKSRDSFKLRLGMGTVLEASGDGEKIIPGGSSICRQALWLYVLTGS